MMPPQGSDPVVQSAPPLDVRIYLSGFPEDLFTLALLFPEGRLEDLYVTSQVQGGRDGIMHRVTDATQTETILRGPGCRRLADVTGFDTARWTALEILAPLNGFATLADSNFVPIDVVRASFEGAERWGSFDLRALTPQRRERLIAADRHQAQRDAMAARVRLMSEDPLAAYAGAVIAGPPSWTDYYRLLEDIAGRFEVRIDRLHQTGLATHGQQRAFTRAANNRLFGRHGESGRSFEGDQRDLMTLLDAKEFVRRVVSAWLDRLCGDYMPRDRVDGPALRFGLDER